MNKPWLFRDSLFMNVDCIVFLLTVTVSKGTMNRKLFAPNYGEITESTISALNWLYLGVDTK